MRGRDVFMQSLLAHGVKHIFGNPGTTETPLLDAMHDYPDLSYVMALHEGVALGAANYYAKASGLTGVVNLHVAPGLGNAIGMLYGALKTGSPLLVTAGQQDTRLRLSEPMLGHDLVAMAAPVTKWAVEPANADELALILRRALKIAHEPPTGPVFVALPINVLEQETENSPAGPGSLYMAPPADPAGIADVAARLLAAESPAIICGDDVAYEGASGELVRLAEALGADVWMESIRQLQPFPTGNANARGGLRLDATAIREALGGADLVLLIGGPFFDDVWFAEGGHFPEGAAVIQIESSQQHLAHNFALDAGLVGGLKSTLGTLADRIAADASKAHKAAAERRNAALAERKEKEKTVYRARLEKAWDRTPTSMPRVMAEVSAAVPDDVIIVDEAITASIDLSYNFEFSAPGDYFGSRGGGIGQGLAGVIGVKVANPDRPVVCISGDGSAMYSIQALWTAAHHNLAIVFVILVNREYRVLKHNADVFRQRFSAPSNRPYPQMDITGPELGFVDLARGMGVPGIRVENADDIKSAMATGLASGGPYVVEVIIEGKP